MSRSAFITGVTGQDGSYLAEFLLRKNYEVHGLARASSTGGTKRIDHLCEASERNGLPFNLHHGDLTDAGHLTSLIIDLMPDEIYNLAAQSNVRVSFDQPSYTFQVTAAGALNVLEAARKLNRRKTTKVYQASSSEMFGNVVEVPQTESTLFRPQSPYGCAKVYAFHQTVNYRSAYDLFAVNGILFNHESPRRGESFVTRKITRAAARIKLGLQDKIYLGNLEAERDWGYAPDYVDGMWRMLQYDVPSDFVLATGKSHSVQAFARLAFEHLGLEFDDHVCIDPKCFRPSEVHTLIGDASYAESELGWKSNTTLAELAELMVNSDLELAGKELSAR